MPVITSGPGYNGVTGAKATYNASEGMWVDTNGERIRTDAIVPGEPPPQPPPAAAAPSPAAPPPTETPGAEPMQALGAAAQGFQEIGAPGLNPALGNRLNPKSLQALASMAGRNY